MRQQTADRHCPRATFSIHSRVSENPACSSVRGTNLAAVVPAQAGTHNHQGFGCRWPCHIALLRRMGPPPSLRLRRAKAAESVEARRAKTGRLRGDDKGESL